MIEYRKVDILTDGSCFVAAEPVHIFLITYPTVFEYVPNMDYSSQLFISEFYRIHQTSAKGL